MYGRDSEIKRNIEEQLSWDDRINTSDIYVTVRECEVTLKGEVPSYVTMRAAVMDAMSIAGVCGVKNEMTVKYPKEAGLPSDEDIEVNILSVFASNPEYELSNVDVSVEGGTVTLMGKVDTYWKKRWAEEMISGIVGVVGIDNRLTVELSRDIGDSEIADSISGALERGLRNDARQIRVVVKDGVTTLSGSVPDWQLYGAVNNAALYASGVIDVKNKIKIG